MGFRAGLGRAGFFLKKERNTVIVMYAIVINIDSFNLTNLRTPN
jgi:hypothetical protein